MIRELFDTCACRARHSGLDMFDVVRSLRPGPLLCETRPQILQAKRLEIFRVRWHSGIRAVGVKTEFTLVQLDCFDAQKQRKLVLLLVWPFGIRKMLSNEEYPESYDENWPQASV